MGGYSNILDRALGRFERHRLASILAGIALIALVGAAESLATESDAIPSNRSVVSTSPTDLAEAASTVTRPATVRALDGPPLTRAATQLRIDQMSPTRWLSGFGNVSIGPRD
jgi:hypothetical protein